MKSKTRRRVIALVLCMVMLLSCGVTTLAEVNTAEPAVTGETAAQENVSAEAQADTAVDDTAVVAESQEKMAAAETAETEKEGTASSDIAVQSETADTEGTESAQTEESTAADTTEQTAGAESGDAAVQSEEETTAGNDAAETSEPETSTENETQTETSDETVGKEEKDTAAFKASYTLADGSAVFTAEAAKNVFPEGTTFQVTKVEKHTEEYQKVEEGLMTEADENGLGLIDFAAYDISFKNSKGVEIEPDGDVQISVEFPEKLDLLGADDEKTEISIKHIKDDDTVEAIDGQVDVVDSDIQSATFLTDEFSIYVITTSGVEDINSSEISNEYVTIEFWDSKQTNTDIKFSESSPKKIDNTYETEIRIHVDGYQTEKYEGYLYGSKDEALHNSSFEPRTSVWPGEGYYFAQQCVWTKTQSSSNKTTEFTGSGVTGFNEEDYYTLDIYLTETPLTSCTSKIASETRPISVELYNYDSDAYNNYVTKIAKGDKTDTLLIRSPWNTTYKNNHYQVSDSQSNAQNNTCGDDVYYGLTEPQLDSNGNIQFNYINAFFDDAFNNAVGTKYSNVNFEFKYDSETNQYSYDSDQNHVHFDGSTISQYQGVGPGVASDGTALEKNGFFPFTDENDNMTDYGFGMKLEVEFNLTADKKIDNENIAFRFSGDDDVWVFVDGKLVLDLGGIHGARNGVIDFVDGVKYNVDEEGNASSYDGINDSNPPAVDEFLKSLSVDETHTLTMYYLERGGDASNCVIEFNLPVTQREGTLQFDKVDGQSQPLADAIFGLYESTEQIENDTPIATAVSDTDGKVQFDISDLTAGKYYYLKEISAPWGYKADDKVYYVHITESREGNGANQKISVHGKITTDRAGDGAGITSITNTKTDTGTGGTTNVTVTKNWDKSAIGYKQPVTMTLYAGTNPEGTQVQRKDNPVPLSEGNWSHTWDALPGDTEYYVVEETEGFTFDVDYDYQFEVNSDFREVRPCSDTYYDLGANGVIAIFGGSNWYVWTSEKLSDAAEQELAKELKSKGLNNGGGVDKGDTEFVSGNATIQLQGSPFEIKIVNGQVILNFQASQNWSFFYMGTYTKTVNAIVTNSLDTEATIDILVTKVWNHNGNKDFHDYPVTVTLKASVDGEEVALSEITTSVKADMDLTVDHDWKGTYTDLPYYMKQSDGTYKNIEYSVTETKMNNSPISLGDILYGYLYEKVEGDQETGFTVTNTYIHPWGIKKVSSTDHNLPLGGAEFTLTGDGGTPVYYGLSIDYYGLPETDRGLIVWWESEADREKLNPDTVLRYIPDGTYTLEETKAPAGYQKSNIKWTIIIENLVARITDESGKTILPEPGGGMTRAVKNTDIYLFKNDALYSLPESGGPGIYWYMLGGVLLMMAGSLLVYKKRRGEVLRRK